MRWSWSNGGNLVVKAPLKEKEGESGQMPVTNSSILFVALLNGLACCEVFSRVRNGENRDAGVGITMGLSLARGPFSVT